MLKVLLITFCVMLLGGANAFLIDGSYTDVWTNQVRVSPHTRHKTFTQCLQNCARPMLPDYKNVENLAFLQKCTKNCMKYQYYCKHFNKCTEVQSGE